VITKRSTLITTNHVEITYSHFHSPLLDKTRVMLTTRSTVITMRSTVLASRRHATDGDLQFTATYHFLVDGATEIFSRSLEEFR